MVEGNGSHDDQRAEGDSIHEILHNHSPNDPGAPAFNYHSVNLIRILIHLDKRV